MISIGLTDFIHRQTRATAAVAYIWPDIFFCLTGLLNPKSSEFLLFFFCAAVLRLLTLPVILAVNGFGDTAVSSNGPVLVS